MMIELGEGKFRFVKVDGRYLFSPYEPFREIERALKRLTLPQKPFFVVFGSAQGYVLEVLFAHGYDASDIWVYEPAEELARWTRENFPWAAEGDLAERLEDALGRRRRPFLFALDGYKRVFSKEFDMVSRWYTVMLSRAVENMKVTAFFGRLWWINYVRNYRLSSSREVGWISDEVKAIPESVVVTASGPSLSRVLPEVQRWQQQGGKVLACLSSWSSLAAAGITPWGVVVSDAGIANRLHAYGLPREVVVFASVYANSSLLVSLENMVVFYDHRSEGTSPSFVLSRPSVVLDALEVAERLFSGRIVVAGLDLSYTSSGTHTQENILSRLTSLSCHRLQTKETIHLSFLGRKDLFQQEERVWSTQPFQLVKMEIEKRFPFVEILSPALVWQNKTLERLFSPIPRGYTLTFPVLNTGAQSLQLAKEFLDREEASIYRREDMMGEAREPVRNYLMDKWRGGKP